MNGVLAHEAKEVDIVKLAGLVARKMMEIATQNSPVYHTIASILGANLHDITRQ